MGYFHRAPLNVERGWGCSALPEVQDDFLGFRGVGGKIVC